MASRFMWQDDSPLHYGKPFPNVIVISQLNLCSLQTKRMQNEMNKNAIHFTKIKCFHKKSWTFI